jgi:hypothetical protein
MHRFLDKYKFGTFKVEGTRIPKVLLGTSPFMGAGQFGPKASEYYMRFFLNPENIKEVILQCIELGVNAVQPFGYPQLVEPIRGAMEEAETEVFVMGSVGARNLEEEIELLESVGAKAIAIHAAIADKDLRYIKNLEELKDRGIVTGIVTHQPGKVIQKVEDVEEIDIILAPVNKLGSYMAPNFQTSVEAVKDSSKRIVAIKPLATGQLEPGEAFEFLSGLVDGVAVGITSKKEAEDTFAAARKFFR